MRIGKFTPGEARIALVTAVGAIVLGIAQLAAPTNAVAASGVQQVVGSTAASRAAKTLTVRCHDRSAHRQALAAGRHRKDPCDSAAVGEQEVAHLRRCHVRHGHNRRRVPSEWRGARVAGIRRRSALRRRRAG